MMIEREDKIVGLEGRSGLESDQDSEKLPYSIEVWQDEDARVERVLGRAASVQLARAIFVSAQTEFPGRRVTVRRGDETVLETQ
jgi:hypothetical protein